MFTNFISLMKTDVVRLMHPPIGLDLGDLSVKMIQLDRKGKGHVIRSFAKSSIPRKSIENGEIQDPDAVVQAIKSVIEKGKPKKTNTRRVMCSIPETKAFLRVIDMPKMSEEEMKEAIHWEIEENIPLAIDQVYYDYEVLKSSLSQGKKNREDVLIVAVARRVVDSFIEVVEKAGLEVMGMEIESLAQARCLLPDAQKEGRSVLVLDIGDRRTSLLFSVGNSIAFTSSTPISSQMITDAYVGHFRITQEKAEKMKIEQGIGSPVIRDPFFRASEPVLENLYSQIQHSMDFISANLGQTRKIDEILLCGGGSNTKHLPLYLSRKTGVPVRIGDPWINVSLGKNIPPISRQEAIQYSTAIGLALQSLYFAYEDIS